MLVESYFRLPGSLAGFCLTSVTGAAICLVSGSGVLAAGSPESGQKAIMSNQIVHRRVVPAVSQQLFQSKLSTDNELGKQALSAGRYDAAIESFKKSLSKNNMDPVALAGYGLALCAQLKLDEADLQFNKALAASPDYPLAHVGKAYVLLNRLQSSSMTFKIQKESMLSEAESHCRQALGKQASLVEALAALGMVHEKKGMLEDACADFSKAIAQDGKFAQAYTQRGLVELEQNNLDAAQSDFKAACELSPSDSLACTGLARVYLAQGNADGAIGLLNKALELAPASAAAQIALADAYRLQHNYESATAAYQKAVLARSDNEQAYLGLSIMQEERGNLELALSDLKAGLELNPDSAPLHLRCGDLNLKLGKSDQAIQQYTSCLQIMPSCADAARGMAQAYLSKAKKEADESLFMSGNFAAARGMILSALKENPADTELRLACDRLNKISGAAEDNSSAADNACPPATGGDSDRLTEARSLLSQLKIAEAGRIMSELISKSADPERLLEIAETALKEHDLAGASAAYGKANNLPSVQAQARRGLASVARAQENARKEINFANDLSAQKQYGSAADKYRNALALDLSSAPAHYGLAEALKNLNSKDPSSWREAAAHYRAYVDLSPSLSEKEKEKIMKMADKLLENAGKIDGK
jgi:tetratricopeptide (TPR) repeat protein